MARRMDNANSQGGAGRWSVTANSASPLAANAISIDLTNSSDQVTRVFVVIVPQ